MVAESEARYQALLAEIAGECPGFRVVRKDRSGLQRAIDVALRLVTLGGQRRYLTDYQTTIGRTVYVTSDWDETDADQRYCTLRHERVHLRQFQRYTLPGMALLYVFVPLPLGLAWCRAQFEKAAYAESICASHQVFGELHVRRPDFSAHIVEQFTGPSYGWMWPFRRSMEAWVKRQIEGVAS